MPTHYPVPTIENIREVLADLMGRAVTVAPCAEAVGADAPGLLADYEVEDGPVGVVCVADLRLAHVLGAALAMEAPETVDAAVEEAQIADPRVEQLQEVVNSMARLFNSADTPPVRLRGVHRLPGEVPEDASALLAGALGRRQYEVTIEEYGSGRLGVAVG